MPRSTLPAGIRRANTTLIREPDGTIRCTLHGTAIFNLHPDGTVYLETGGYKTPTTFRRMSECLFHFRIPRPSDGIVGGGMGMDTFRSRSSYVFQSGVVWGSRPLPRLV